MSFDSAISRNDYTGDGTTDTYDYCFYIFEDADLLVTVRDTNGVEYPLTLDTDYLVSGEGEETGGAVELVHSGQTWLDSNNCFRAGWHFTVRRVLSEVQTTDLRNQGNYFPNVIEDQLDRCVMIDQQQQDQLDRAVTLPETVPQSGFDPRLPANIVGAARQALIVNDAGNGIGLGSTVAVGPQGPAGPAGTNGTNGTNGQGVPAGGATAAILVKNSGTDYDTQWRDLIASDIPNALPVAKTTVGAQAISASNIDWSTGSAFTKTLGASTTFTFSNQTSGQTIVVRLTNTASNWTVTWPTVLWAGGSAPTMTVGAHSDVYTFFYDGANIYGSAVQNF